MQCEHDRAVISASAHEFNNELTVILGSALRSISALEPGHPARGYLLELEQAALRCAGLTWELLALGGEGPSMGLLG